MMFDYPVVFVDIETTGGGYKNSRVIEIAALRVERGEIVDEFSTLIDPETYIPSFITDITGITKEDVEGAPKFADIADRLSEVLEGAVFVAHNVNFDYSFIRAEFARLGATFSTKRLCTVRLSRMLYPEHKGHSLEKLIHRHSIPFRQRHRALDDARAIQYFSQLAYDHCGETAFRAACTQQLKSQYVPINLDQEHIQSIENAPGVYIFRDENGVVLYIGKSIDMKKRVISHFQDMSAKEVKIAQKTRTIETIPTYNELLALLLESRLIKKLSPVFNVKLRRMTTYSMVVKQYDELGYPKLGYVEGVPQYTEQIGNIYGMYDTKTKAKKWVDLIARTHDLCPRLMGIEKTKGACFNYSLGKCRGACVGEESVAAYEARFEAAMGRNRLQTWPYAGEIELGLGDGGSMTVDNWMITSITTGHEWLAELTTKRFDLDEYKILRAFLQKQHPITLLS